MAWFTKPLAEPTTIPRANPASDELQSIEAEYQKAEREFFAAGRAVLAFQREHPKLDAVTFINAGAYVRTNALSLADPELQKLCSLREDARRRRNELLNERANLLRRAGKVR